MIDRDKLLSTVLAFVPPELPTDPATPAAVEAGRPDLPVLDQCADGALPPGSEAHKREVCRMFRETFNPYSLRHRWPKLSPEELRRLTSLPIWDIAVQTEGRARLRFAAYANSVADPDMQAAIMLNAWEETGTRRSVELVVAYGITLAERAALSTSTRSGMGIPRYRIL